MLPIICRFLTSFNNLFVSANFVTQVWWLHWFIWCKHFGRKLWVVVITWRGIEVYSRHRLDYILTNDTVVLIHWLFECGYCFCRCCKLHIEAESLMRILLRIFNISRGCCCLIRLGSLITSLERLRFLMKYLKPKTSIWRNAEIKSAFYDKFFFSKQETGEEILIAIVENDWRRRAYILPQYQF